MYLWPELRPKPRWGILQLLSYSAPQTTQGGGKGACCRLPNNPFPAVDFWPRISALHATRIPPQKTRVPWSINISAKGMYASLKRLTNTALLIDDKRVKPDKADMYVGQTTTTVRIWLSHCVTVDTLPRRHDVIVTWPDIAPQSVDLHFVGYCSYHWNATWNLRLVFTLRDLFLSGVTFMPLFSSLSSWNVDCRVMVRMKDYG